MTVFGEAKINSLAYWDQRFDENWEQVQGPRQTRFFCELALANWPSWLWRSMVRDQLSFCDWGCALGDGADVFGQALGTAIHGVDFSVEAIKRAQIRYPGHEFAVEDWLTEPATSRFDIVFSSNTLEHFANPWQAFGHVAEHARQHIVLLLPYEEASPLTPEHAVRFDADNLPVTPLPDWVLADSKVIDCSGSPYWGGKQILLVYSTLSSLASLNIMVADRLSWAATSSTNRLADESALRAEIAELRAEVTRGRREA